MRNRIQCIERSFFGGKQAGIHYAVREVGLSQQVVIAGGNIPHVGIGLHVLNVGFHHWVKALDRGYFVTLARDDAIDGFIDGLDSRARNSCLWRSLTSWLPRLSGSRAGQNANQEY